MNAIPIIGLLVYTFGIYAFGALSWYQLLGSARGECAVGGPKNEYSRLTDRLSTLIVVTSLLWFVVMLLLTLGSFIRVGTSWLQSLQLLILYAFPPLIMHLGHAEAVDRNPLRVAPAWKWVHRVIWPASQLVSVGLVLSYNKVIDIVPRGALGPTLGVSISLLFGLAAIHGVLMLSRTRERDETPRQRSARRWTVGLFLLLLILVLPSFTNQFGAVMQLLGSSMPLVFMFVGVYHESRFEFFDLFIKRGLSLWMTIVLLTAFFGLALPRLEQLELGWARPWVYTVALLPVVMILPWLHSRIALLLDNVMLGRRYATVEAVKHVLSGLQSATDEDSLVRQAQQRLGMIFQAPSRIVLELSEAPPGDFDCVLQVPVTVGGRPVGTVLMGRRANQTPYFSEDRALLASLTDVFSYSLQNMRLQQKKQEHEQRAKELSLSASRSELKALRAQINPHFLFNALNAIAGLIHRDPALADSTVEQLAEVFRYTLSGSEKEWAIVEQEMEFVQAYLEVERARFGERLQFEIRLEDEVRAARIPTMVIQTLVENAVKHGIAVVRRSGRIEVCARGQDGMLRIEVADNGPGFGLVDELPAQKKGSSYGLKNIRHRLEGYFGERARLTTERDEQRGRTVVAVTIPIGHDDAVETSEREAGGAA